MKKEMTMSEQLGEAYFDFLTDAEEYGKLAGWADRSSNFDPENPEIVKQSIQEWMDGLAKLNLKLVKLAGLATLTHKIDF